MLADGLERFGRLSHGDRDLLAQAVGRVDVLQAGMDVLTEGDRPPGCMVVLEGALFSYKLLSDGRRQILSFLIPGDLAGSSGLMLGRMDHSVAALMPSSVATVPRQAMMEMVATRPSIAQALWRETQVAGAVTREWVANIGQRPAYQRIAHLICEMRARFEAAGLGANGRIAWPFTQAHIAEATGLSSVHVNRTLQQIRGDGLITLNLGTLVIHDWKGLQQAGDFTPAYLFLPPSNNT